MANKKLSALITIGGAISSTLTSAVTGTKSKLQEIGSAVKSVEARQKELNRVIREQEQIGTAGAALRAQEARQELQQLDQRLSKLRQIGSALRANDRAVEANLARRSQLRGQIGDTLAFGASILLPAGAAFRSASEFNYQLQLIGNTADMTRSEIVELGRDIMRLSDETGQSAQTVQTAIGFLVAAGMDLDLARGSMRAIGRTATATASEIEDVSRAAFTLNDTMGVIPENMQGALDILVQAGKEGNFEFKAMAQNIPVLGASFRALKMVGAEAVGTMGAALQIARKGAGDEGEAANNLRNFLAKVLAPDTLKKAEKLGSDLYGVVSGAQARGENPFEAAIAEINRITQGGDQKLLGELFQDMQVQNFLRPMLQNLEEYQRIKRVSLGAGGVVDRDFIKMSEQTKQQWNEMANAAGRLSVAVGSALEPAMGALFVTMKPVLNAVTEFVNAHPNIVGGAIMAVGGLVALRLGVLAAGYAFTFLRGGILNVAGLMIRIPGMAAAAATAFRAVGSALLFAGRGVLWVGRALLMNPIGLAVTAIAGSVFLIYKYWEPLRDFFTGLWSDITETARGAFDWILSKIDAVGAGWRRTKEFFGFGDSTPASTPAPTSLPALPTPAMATARGGAATQITDNSQTTLQIVQQPGEDADRLAERVMRRLEQRKAVRGRSLMYDPVTP